MAVVKHLAIFSVDDAKQILNGQKSVEIRFSKKKNEPFGKVSFGDLVYIKPSGGEIVGQFIVKKVIYFDGLDEADFELIKKTFAKNMAFGNKDREVQFFEKNQQAKTATIIEIGQVEQFLTSPIKIPKKDSRGWMVLD